jgi:integrase
MDLPNAIERLLNVLRRQHKAIATEASYVYWLRHYVTALKDMPNSLPSERKLENFLTNLARNRNLAASTQNQAFNAILYFYNEVLRQPLQNIDALRARRPARLRHAPTVAETQGLLQTVRDRAGYPINLIVRILYGCGLRVCEPLNLRIKDVKLQELTLFILGAKGGKDRVVAIPPSVVPELGQQIKRAQTIWLGDKQNRIPVDLPFQLARKFPEYQYSWPWAWLFPSHNTCFHPRTHLENRYRMHEANVQWAIKEARRKLGISVLPHELRRGYATHSMANGVSPRAIQIAMGHNSLETTMRYLHAESLSVQSPLESILAGKNHPFQVPLGDQSAAPAPHG